ncbi:MAG TPA: FAD-dependent oxidoreductase, partial [Polyangia bacterium]
MTQLTLTAAQGGSLRVEAETALAPRIVTSEAATRAEPKAVSAAAPARLVIIGNGMVSHRLCQTLASFNQQRYAITVFSDEGLPAYDRVHVSDVLAGRPPTSLMLASPAWYRDHAIDLRLGEPIIGIDLQQKTILTANGQRASYDKLVIASGSAPLLPAIKIDDWNGVFVLRTLDDVERMQAVAATAHRAVIIGGGVQGLETAAALQRPGLELTILEAGGHLMNRQLDATAAALLKEQLESRGIRVRLQTR